MPLFSGLARRDRQPEMMDQPSLARSRHERALRGLERINRWSRSADILWPPIQAYARRRGVTSLSILDLASGAGDVPIALWARGIARGLAPRVEGWDVSPVAVEHAHARARERGAPVTFFVRDAFDAAPLPHCDIICCSLFLHHLDESDAVRLLRKMGQAARGLVLVNDLIRCRAGLLLALAGPGLLTASEVVRVDAVRSVRAAYTLAEADALAREAGLEGTRLTTHWPFRYLLEWRRG